MAVALSITACGLCLSDEAIRVAVGLCLGLNICEPHRCPCGATVTSIGTHGLSCQRSSGCSTRHQQINDAIWKALKRADVPSTKEPAGVFRGDGKRPDGLNQMPWQIGRRLTWDVTALLWTLWPALSRQPRQWHLVERRRQLQRERELSTPKSSSQIFSFPQPSRLWDQSIWRVNASLIAAVNVFFRFRRSKRNHIPIAKTICTYQNFQFGCLSWYSPSRDSY